MLNIYTLKNKKNKIKKWSGMTLPSYEAIKFYNT